MPVRLYVPPFVTLITTLLAAALHGCVQGTSTDTDNTVARTVLLSDGRPAAGAVLTVRSLENIVSPDGVPAWKLLASDTADEEIERAKIILWKGYCTTHMRFNLQQIEKARAEYPGIKVLVHPECRQEVVAAADLYGSTEYIIEQIEKAPAGSQWAVATEINLVHRLAKEHPEQLIFCLDPIVCPCSTMYRIHPAYLAWVLEGLVKGEVINQVSVDQETVYWARVALERMLALK